MQYPRRTILRLTIVTTLVTSFPADTITTVHAGATEVCISHDYGILHLPIIIMTGEHLLEEQAKAAGLGDVGASYRALSGGDVINDIVPSGVFDIASLGMPGPLILRGKTHGSATEVYGLSSLSSSSMYLTTRNPDVKTLADLSDKDRIVVPGIEASPPAMVLQTTIVKTFGDKQFNKPDPTTVPLPHPDATVVMLAGGNQINSRMTSPPLSHAEAAAPGLHRVFSTVDVLGNITLDVAYISKRFHEASLKLSAVSAAALDEVNTLIAKDRAKATQIYIAQLKVKSPSEEVRKILGDPDSCFTTAPADVAYYVELMQRVGMLKNKPASWRDLFFSTAQS